MSYEAAPDRYDRMPYRRCGRSGLKLPVISLGLWQNFGDDRSADEVSRILTRAFDLGITHFDLADNYGPPYGAAESNAGKVFSGSLAPYRDELVIATKAGYDMWPGPYGDGGSASISSAVWMPAFAVCNWTTWTSSTPTDSIRTPPWKRRWGHWMPRSVRARRVYVGISSYPPEQTEAAADILSELGTPLFIHQPAYSMFNRWIESGLLEVLGRREVGCIVFMSLQQGLLTDRYLDGVPRGSRASRDGTLGKAQLGDDVLDKVRSLQEIAERRHQTMAQMALAWTLRDLRVTSTLIGVSSVIQLEQNVATIEALEFTSDELEEIDKILRAR